ncbi:MAG: mechanosensitive ion channel [Rickettsiales bacterium]|nr:mechanosensitive ion channel [Rickettsiales bacterium]
MQQFKLIIILITLPFCCMADSIYNNISFSAILDNGVYFFSKVWNYKIVSLESQSVTVANIIIAVISFIIGLRVARYLSSSFKRKLFSLIKLDRNSTNLISRIVDYLFLIIIIIIVLDIAGVPLNIFTFIGGAFVISVGLSSQHLFNNFISGIALIIESKIKVGDLIEFEDLIGRVEGVEARMVQIRTRNNMEVFIPHSKLMQERFTNWSYNGGRVRIHTELKIDQKDNINNNFEDIVLNAVMQNHNILTIPKPQILLNSIENNILNYEVNFWINVHDVDRRVILSEVNNQILNTLRAYHIPLAVETIRHIK